MKLRSGISFSRTRLRESGKVYMLRTIPAKFILSQAVPHESGSGNPMDKCSVDSSVRAAHSTAKLSGPQKQACGQKNCLGRRPELRQVIPANDELGASMMPPVAAVTGQLVEERLALHRIRR